MRRVLSAALVIGCSVAGYTYAADNRMHPGVGVTLVPLSVMDGTSYHLDTLRSRMEMPQSSVSKCGAVEMPYLRDNFWITYEGGYNRFGGDSSMESYDRTFQGLLMGLDRQLCSASRVGLAFGYEHSISRTGGTKYADDAYFVDVYAAVRTGSLNHRFIVGVGMHDKSGHRGLDVLTPFTPWHDGAHGSTDARTIHVGYELSKDYRWSESTVLTPFFVLNYAFAHFDNMSEVSYRGLSMNTSYDDLNLLQSGVGGRMAYTFSVLPNWKPATLSTSLAAMVEFSKHRVKASHGVVGGPEFRVQSLKRDPFYMQLGFDLKMPMYGQWDMVAGVFGRLGPDRGGIAGNVGLQYEF